MVWVVAGQDLGVEASLKDNNKIEEFEIGCNMYHVKVQLTSKHMMTHMSCASRLATRESCCQTLTYR